MTLWYALIDLLPFQWAEPGKMYFMKNALLAILVISPLFGLLSTMVVEKRMAFFSDALGHSAFTGVAIGTLCGLVDATWCAVALAVVFALSPAEKVWLLTAWLVWLVAVFVFLVVVESLRDSFERQMRLDGMTDEGLLELGASRNEMERSAADGDDGAEGGAVR